MTDTRYSVTLSATCDDAHLKDTVAVLQEATPALAGLDLDDFALRVYRLDNDEEAEEVPAADLPTAP
jgi:hypothetical protein